MDIESGDARRLTVVRNLDHCLTKGLQRVSERRRPDGLWSDYRTEAGRSDEWVSGFALCALSYCDTPAELLATTRQVLIRRQRRNGGWGYNKRIPADCDSTGWVLLALTTTSQRPSIVARACNFQRRHQSAADGGFSTYIPGDRIHEAVGIPTTTPLPGWQYSQPCVTALVVRSLLASGVSPEQMAIKRATDYLLALRQPSGMWPSYWWKGNAYSTYLSLSALWEARRISCEYAQRSIDWIMGNQRPDGGWNGDEGEPSKIFETAFSVLSLLFFRDHKVIPAARRGVNWLIEKQLRTGGWATAPIMRIPSPLAHKPPGMTDQSWEIMKRGTDVAVADSGGIYSGCSALWALSAYRRSAMMA